MHLTDDEKAMLDGRGGRAQQKAMDLLVRYAEALGAERFVDTRNVAGVPGSANPFLQDYYRGRDAGGLDAIFSHFDLDSVCSELAEFAVHGLSAEPGRPPTATALDVVGSVRREIDRLEEMLTEG